MSRRSIQMTMVFSVHVLRVKVRICYPVLTPETECSGHFTSGPKVSMVPSVRGDFLWEKRKTFRPSSEPLSTMESAAAGRTEGWNDYYYRHPKSLISVFLGKLYATQYKQQELHDCVSPPQLEITVHHLGLVVTHITCLVHLVFDYFPTTIPISF